MYPIITRHSSSNKSIPWDPWWFDLILLSIAEPFEDVSCPEVLTSSKSCLRPMETHWKSCTKTTGSFRKLQEQGFPRREAGPTCRPYVGLIWNAWFNFTGSLVFNTCESWILFWKKIRVFGHRMGPLVSFVCLVGISGTRAFTLRFGLHLLVWNFLYCCWHSNVPHRYSLLT